MHYYEGNYNFLGSINAQIEDEFFIWTAYFKGPVVGYEKSRNRQFIVYSPSCTYNCVTSLSIHTNPFMDGNKRRGNSEL
jgi:hypothetical protein